MNFSSLIHSVRQRRFTGIAVLMAGRTGRHPNLPVPEVGSQSGAGHRRETGACRLVNSAFPLAIREVHIGLVNPPLEHALCSRHWSCTLKLLGDQHDAPAVPGGPRGSPTCPCLRPADRDECPPLAHRSAG